MLKRTLIMVFGIAMMFIVAQPTGVSAATTTTSTASVKLTTSGEMSLNSAPSYDFGSSTIQETDQNGMKAVSGNDVPVMVTNPGYGSGWHVSVSLGTFKSSTHAGIVLKGAQIVLTPSKSFQGTAVDDGTVSVTAADMANRHNGIVTTTDNVTGSDPWSEGLPTATSATLSQNSAASTIFSASLNSGVGIWQTAYDATLNVPAGNVEGSYSANMTWTLENTPDATSAN
jgi:hypothetical protein